MLERSIFVTIFRNCATLRNSSILECHRIMSTLRKSVARKLPSFLRNPRYYPPAKKARMLISWHLISRSQSPSDTWNVLRRYRGGLAGSCRDVVHFLLLSDARKTGPIAVESLGSPRPVHSRTPCT